MFSRTKVYFNKPHVAAWVFLMPSLLTLLLFVFVPLIAACAMAFFRVNIFLTDIGIIGLGNFTELVSDVRFWNSLKNTFAFTLGVVPFGTFISLLTALYVCKNTPARKFLRVMFYAPVVCSMTAMGIVWSVLMDPSIGMFSLWADFIGLQGFMFLHNPDWALLLIIVMTIWKTFGLAMIIFVAALQSIPDFYYESADIDGASGFVKFRSITLPMIFPVLGFCLITGTIQSLMVFDQTYIMTRGGPMFRTETMVQYIYSRAFSMSPFRLGYASALALVLFVIIGAVSLLMYRYFIKHETEGAVGDE